MFRDDLMAIKKIEIEQLRKQYPAEKFDLVESQGSLIVRPKKAVIWALKKDVKLFERKGAEQVSKKLDELMKKKRLRPEDFKQAQIAVLKETAMQLKEQASRCGVRQINYLHELIAGD